MVKSKKRIVIIGSAGVGKTTLINSLNIVKLKKIPELARIICKDLGYKNIYDIKDQNKFRFLTLKKQIELEEKCKEFISDRSCIDCWVYWMRWSWESAKTNETEKFFAHCFNQAKKYSHIIYIPRIIKSKEDGFRWNDESYQKQVDRLFRSTLLEWDLMKRTFVIDSTNLKERVSRVKEFLT